MHALSGSAIDEAGFRREAAHALSTPLGGLLLQAELIEYFLKQEKLTKAQEAASSLMQDCESFGRLLRSVFSAMADMAEAGTDHGDPRTCLLDALDVLGDEAVGIEYCGESPSVAVPGIALNALMRRLAVEATALGAENAALSGFIEGPELRLSLTAHRGERAVLMRGPFEGSRAMNLWVVRQIAARYNGALVLDDETPELLGLRLPIAVDPSAG